MRGDSTPLLTERDPVAVRALRAALRIADLPGFVCMCWGDVALDFLDDRDAALTRVTLHHGYSVRWEGWREDAVLAAGELSLEWLAVRGVTGPLREFRAAERRAAEAERVERLWAAAVPEPLEVYTPLFLDTSRTGGRLPGSQLAEMWELLCAAHPDAVARVLRLLTWYSAGTGAYSGYPVHEGIPAQFLDCETPRDFARAVERADQRALAGAVRYVIGWHTRHRVDGLLMALSPAARQRLLTHTRDTETRGWLARRIARFD
ncbi:hypothetical protein [Nocardia sp. NPDC057668]|uniref:hypothetical protein n=1 Tax=Nocardia sp. NPDC057668 TaxID=3346202 RepID=UPI0036729EC4